MREQEDPRTTSDPDYLAARRKLDELGSEITAEDLALLLGITSKTARNWANLGRFGSRKVGPNWYFDNNLVRAEIGLPPLSLRGTP
jgi:hypothetical protein